MMERFRLERDKAKAAFMAMDDDGGWVRHADAAAKIAELEQQIKLARPAEVRDTLRRTPSQGYARKPAHMTTAEHNISVAARIRDLTEAVRVLGDEVKVWRDEFKSSNADSRHVGDSYVIGEPTEQMDAVNANPTAKDAVERER